MRDVDREELLAHSEYVRALARRLVLDPDRADDVAQETMLAALSHPPQRRGPLRDWLGRVARNIAYRTFRNDERRSRREARHARPDRVRAAGDVVADLQLHREVVDALLQLDEPYRATLIMHFFEGMQPRAIATRTNRNGATVRSHLKRGIERLRCVLDERHGGDRKAWCLALLSLAFPAKTAGAATVTTVGGGILFTMKKAAAILVLLVTASLFLWSSGNDQATPPERRAHRTEPAPSDAAPEHGADVSAAPSKARTVLRAKDSVSSFTFAGRVVDPQGGGVGRARVRLAYWMPPPGVVSYGISWHLVKRSIERQVTTAMTTNARGYFRFDRPYASASYLLVTADGYPPTLSGWHEPGKFIEVVLDPDRLLRVRVDGPDGKPLAGCPVRLATRPTQASQARQILLERTTDESGTVVLPVAPDWNFLVEADPLDPSLGLASRDTVNKPGDVVLRVPRVGTRNLQIVDATSGAPLPDAYVLVCKQFRSASAEHQRVRRRFDAGVDGTVTVPNQKGYFPLFATAPGYESKLAWGEPLRLQRATGVRGVVLDPEGNPIPDAALLVALPEGAFERSFSALPIVAARTGADGRFDFEIKMLIPTIGYKPGDPGVRSILALHPDYAPAIADGLPVDRGGRHEVTLRFPKPTTLEIEVVDEVGKPLGGQRLYVVRAIPRSESWNNRGPANGLDLIALQERESIQTDKAGRVVVKRLAPGSYTLRAGTTRKTVDVREGVVESVRLVRGATPGITVRVLDAAGKPVAGVEVGLSGPDAARKKANKRGEVCFLDLRPGTYVAAVSAKAWRGRLSREVQPGEEIELRMPTGPARLCVFVDGPPAGTVECSVMTETGGYTKFAKLAEPYTTSPFTPGDGVVIVRAKGHGYAAVRFRASPERTMEVRIALPRAGRVEGLAHMADKQDFVRLVREDGYPYALAGESKRLPYALQMLELGDRPDKEGRFAIEGVHPTSYRASLGHFENLRTMEGRRWIEHKSVRIEVVPGETVTIDLR